MTSEAVLPMSAAAPIGAAVRPPVPKRVVVATVAGNALEFYDFVTYAYFAVYIGKAFFPASTPFVSLLLSVAVFGVGFIFRPLGGLVIGAYADRVGRRPAMLLTIALITVGTLGLAFTPSYATIGVAAPLIVVACRLVQGLALGGEVGPASAFLLEVAPDGRRAFYSAWQLASQGIASLAAGIVGFALSLVLSQADLESWGWRVPFVLCVALVPLALYLRSAMPETLEEGHAVDPAERARLTAHMRLVTLGVLVILGGTVSTYVSTYMTTYAISTLHLPASVALAATMMVGLGTLVGALIGGRLADAFGRRKVMLTPRIVLALAIVPLFLWIQASPTATTLLVATLAFTTLNAMSSAAAFVIIPELLPRTVRATGLAVAYAVGVSVFGGTTQFVITWLIGTTGNEIAPAWYVLGTSLITLAAMWALPESKERAL